MSGQPPERRLAKFLGVFSFSLGIAQLGAPDRINDLIGVKDTPKTRAIQRALGVQELTAAQGIFGFSPPTLVLWSRVAGDLLHTGLLMSAVEGVRNQKRRRRRRGYDEQRLLGAIGAVALIGIVDATVAALYQRRWPKEPTPGQPLPAHGDEEHIKAHTDGYPAITIRASQDEIRPRLREFGIEDAGEVVYRRTPGDRGTEVIILSTRRTDQLKANLRQVKQTIEVGEVVRSDAAPDGGRAKRQIRQRPAQPLNEKKLAKIGGDS